MCVCSETVTLRGQSVAFYVHLFANDSTVREVCAISEVCANTLMHYLWMCALQNTQQKLTVSWACHAGRNRHSYFVCLFFLAFLILCSLWGKRLTFLCCEDNASHKGRYDRIKVKRRNKTPSGPRLGVCLSLASKWEQKVLPLVCVNIVFFFHNFENVWSLGLSLPLCL